MGIPGVETLSDEAKKWLAHAIAGMTVADGEVVVTKVEENRFSQAMHGTVSTNPKCSNQVTNDNNKFYITP